ncbi:fibronectin type III domain-containing protein [Candidatus Poriferisocius sp.]|uniref:fibronectin type III domain-containing protein n=1 Tax=Candidatus Poriferisocius sp. TaxID=3101276 RepID=UPI003B0270C5
MFKNAYEALASSIKRTPERYLAFLPGVPAVLPTIYIAYKYSKESGVRAAICGRISPQLAGFIAGGITTSITLNPGKGFLAYGIGVAGTDAYCGLEEDIERLWLGNEATPTSTPTPAPTPTSTPTPPPQQPLTDPSNVLASCVKGTSIKVIWLGDRSGQTSKYTVQETVNSMQRRRATEPLTLIATGGTTEITFNNITSGVAYSFAVIGYSSKLGVYSSWLLQDGTTTCSSASVTTPVPTPSSTPVPVVKPSAPNGLTVVGGIEQVVLSWDDPDNTSITKYQYRKKVGQKRWGRWTNIPGSNDDTVSLTVSGLTGGVKYRFQVRAINSTGTGTHSKSVAATPTPRPTPVPRGLLIPTNVRAVCSSNSSTITVTWDDESTVPIAWYDVSDRYGSGLAKRVTNGSTVTFNATAGTKYSFAISSYSSTLRKFSEYGYQSDTTTC